MTRQFMSKFLEVRRIVGIASFVAALAATWALAAVALAAPTVATAPGIQGTPVQEGKAVTFVPGTWNDATAVTVSDGNWQLCNLTCADTGQSTATAYTIPAGAAGGTIQVVETATATDGTNSSTASTTTVLPPAPTPATGLPAVTGSGLQNQTLTAVHGGWNGSPTTYTDTWYRCTPTCVSTAIVGPTYLLGLADVGSTIEVVETATNSGGTSATSETSPQTAAVVGVPVSTLPPAIIGTPQQGQVLAVTQGTWSNSPTLGEQWEDCAGLVCTPILGQTGTSYTVGAGDVGHTIQVVETAVNAAAPLGVGAASTQTGTASATSATSVVVFSQNSPNTNEAVTLVATVSSSSGNANPHGSLSFFDGSNAISGCANKGVSGGQTITIVCQTSFGAGQAQVSAAYLADPTSLVAGSTSTTTSVDIGKGSTSMSLAVTPKVAPGGHATYVATLGVPFNSAGPILPNGSIEFLDGGQPIGGCGNQAVSNLTATCSVSYRAAGLHSITARYDGDSNFTGSTSPAGGVQIVAGAPKKPKVLAALGSTVYWKFAYRPRYSWALQFRAYAVLKGTTVLVRCFGKGCPFSTWRTTAAAGTINLQPHLGHHHLRAGDRVIVRFTRKNWIGRYYTIRIRPGRKPKMTLSCLAPNKVRTAVACPQT
ncbi:MAG TPA: Ig-like domain repeat protein [Solirubrobacteraceae bacterium]|nr:Ig-like domain repeat protein [Solirubrobacteraceae bacterium]